jgi:hypothetical protein
MTGAFLFTFAAGLVSCDMAIEPANKAMTRIRSDLFIVNVIMV